MIDASAEVGKLITTLSEVQTERDTARRELEITQAEVVNLAAELGRALGALEMWQVRWDETHAPAPEWIPCTEPDSILPEDEQRVLVALRIGKISRVVDCKYNKGISCYTWQDVTHWMPFVLPEPPTPASVPPAESESAAVPAAAFSDEDWEGRADDGIDDDDFPQHPNGRRLRPPFDDWGNEA